MFPSLSSSRIYIYIPSLSRSFASKGVDSPGNYSSFSRFLSFFHQRLQIDRFRMMVTKSKGICYMIKKRGIEREGGNNKRIRFVSPSFTRVIPLSLFLSGYQNDEGKKEKETGAPVARAGVYIYSIRVFKDDSGVVYPGNKGVIPAEAGSRGGRCRVGSA